MHDITVPNIIMKWRIKVANPVKPEHWELVYDPHIHYGNPRKFIIWYIINSGDVFEVRLAVKPEIDLPTQPTIKVYGVIGFPGVRLYIATVTMYCVLLAD